MGANCCEEPAGGTPHGRYRRALWIALAVNIAMFLVEIASGVSAGSVSLLADSLDFLGDSANYAISLWALGMGLATRARTAQLKALTMGAFGTWVLASAVTHALTGVLPHAATMGAIGTLALAANVGVAVLLYGFRNGDSNMRSVWLCTRNDAIGNVAVMLAALGVFGTGAAWPDLAVAAVMAALALSSACQVLRHARAELAAH